MRVVVAGPACPVRCGGRRTGNGRSAGHGPGPSMSLARWRLQARPAERRCRAPLRVGGGRLGRRLAVGPFGLATQGRDALVPCVRWPSCQGSLARSDLPRRVGMTCTSQPAPVARQASTAGGRSRPRPQTPVRHARSSDGTTNAMTPVTCGIGALHVRNALLVHIDRDVTCAPPDRHRERSKPPPSDRFPPVDLEAPANRWTGSFSGPIPGRTVRTQTPPSGGGGPSTR